MFEHNVYNQFIPTPAQAEQNCNNDISRRVTLSSFSSCKNSNQTIHYKQTIQHHIITKECLLASKRFFVEGTIKKDAQELQMYNKHSLGKLFILLTCLIFEWRTRRLRHVYKVATTTMAFKDWSIRLWDKWRIISNCSRYNHCNDYTTKALYPGQLHNGFILQWEPAGVCKWSHLMQNNKCTQQMKCVL